MRYTSAGATADAAADATALKPPATTTVVAVQVRYALQEPCSYFKATSRKAICPGAIETQALQSPGLPAG